MKISTSSHYNGFSSLILTFIFITTIPVNLNTFWWTLTDVDTEADEWSPWRLRWYLLSLPFKFTFLSTTRWDCSTFGNFVRENYSIRKKSVLTNSIHLLTYVNPSKRSISIKIGFCIKVNNQRYIRRNSSYQTQYKVCD